MEEIQNAISNNNLESLEKLLENKSLDDCCWALYYTLWAMTRGENQSTDKATKTKKLVEMLLERGVDLNIVFDPFRFTLFEYACRYATVDVVELMIDHGADVNSDDEHGTSVLGTAIERSNLELIKCLIKNGANVKRCILELAVQTKELAIVKAILDLSKTEVSQCVDDLIIHAIKTSSREVVELLLDCGANVNGIKCDNSLSAAVQCGKEEIVKLLLDRGAESDGEILKTAVCSDHPKVVKLLLSRGFDANYIYSNESMLYLAVILRKSKEIITLLLDYEAEVNRKSPSTGLCPLHFAARFGDKDIFKLLIHHGADINVLYNEGGTALNTAYMFDKQEVYEFLVKKIVLMKSLGLFVNKVNLGAIEANKKLAAFKKECVDELELVKSENLHDSTLTYFEFLRSNDIDKLAGLARNESITDVIRSNDFMIKFPLYTELIVDHLNKGSLRNKDFDLFKRFVNYLSTRRTDKLPNLPFTFVCDLFGYLTDKDIAKLRKL